MRRNRRSKNDNIKRVAIGGAVAAVAGYVAGILTAPKSGRETRGDIKKTTNASVAQAEKELKKLNADLGKAIDEGRIKGDKLGAKARNELSEAMDKARDTKEKVREVISAIHEGDAEDIDLKKAVKEADKALEHLREFFKK
jgi:gas vesicle protein